VNCPCGQQTSAENCCLRFIHAQAKPATAEELMRSRFTAFATQQVDYLLKTHWGHESDLALKAELEAQPVNWLDLKIHETQAGQKSDRRGKVKFTARYLDDLGQVQEMTEHSTFIKKRGFWYYEGC
jgi:SEC-C motif-containing protein